MVWLVIGVLVWAFAHGFKRLIPGARGALDQRLGESKARGVVASSLFLSVALMIVGYRSAAFYPVYSPLPGIGHLNNLLMLFAVMLMGAGSSRGRIRSLLRHPMLTGVAVWGVAHLLVNGDLASVILFGSMVVWALAEMVLINRAEPDWQRPAPGPVSGDIRLVIISLVIYGIFAGVHIFLGHNPFLGTYG